MDVQVERAARAVASANTVNPTKGRTKPAMETVACKFYLTAEGCKFGDNCRYKHPRTPGRCLRCGAEGHSLSTCTRPSKNKSGGQPKQMAKGKGRSTSTPTSSKPSSSAKPKAQPKKKGDKGGGKGKKDKSSTKPSGKSSAKAGEVSFDNDDVEEDEHDAECDWDENEEDVIEEEQEDTFAERAFATAYHSHVCEVCDTEDADSGLSLGEAATQEVSQAGTSAEQARIAAAAVMRTNFPSMLAEMNPDWDPLTEQDLLRRPEDTSDSMELVSSAEGSTTDEHDSDSDERGGFPNIQRVVAVPAHLTEDGGLALC